MNNAIDKAKPVTDEHGTVYTPWADSQGAVGYHYRTAAGREGYMYLNPSSEDTDGVSNVFVYSGTTGSPETDHAEMYLNCISGGE